MSKNKIDVSQILERDWKNLAITFLGAVERFYENPENIKRFEEWKKKQEAKEDKNVDQRRKTDDNGHHSGSGSGISSLSCVDSERHSYAR